MLRDGRYSLCKTSSSHDVLHQHEKRHSSTLPDDTRKCSCKLDS